MTSPGQLNSDLRKLAVNMSKSTIRDYTDLLVPFTRLHFFTAGYAPLVATASKSYTGTTVADLTAAIFQKKSLLAAIDPSLGKYLTVSVAYRGKALSMRDSQSNHS